MTSPEEHDGLANEHANCTGSETSEDTQNGGDNNEAENAREGVGESARRRRRVVVSVVVRRRGRGRRHIAVVKVKGMRVTLRAETLGTVELGHGEELVHVELVVMLARAVVTTHGAHGALVALVSLVLAALVTLGLALAHHARLGRAHQTPDTSEEKLLHALGLARALLPGQFIGRRGGVFDLGLRNREVTGSVFNQADCDRVDRDGFGFQVEDCETDIDQFNTGSVIGGWDGHHFYCIAHRHSLGLFAIFKLLDGGNRSRGNGREDLVAIDVQAVGIDGEIQDLREVSQCALCVIDAVFGTYQR